MLPGTTEKKSSLYICGEFSGGLLVRILGFHCLDLGLGKLRSYKLHFVAKKLKKKKLKNERVKNLGTIKLDSNRY